MTKELVRLDQVTVSFDDAPCLERADFKLDLGDYTGIVGPSGAGKTTLLKVLAGAVKPTGGRVIHAPGVRVGYVPQVDQINWYFPVTVIETLLMAGDRHRLAPWASRADRAKAIELLSQLGIGELAGRQIRALSGGQQQRVFIARALMGEPDALLLDEPTSGVDVATRHDVLHVLHDLNHDRGIAVVITTHDLNGIAAHMHTIVCLNRKIITAGPPSEVLTREVLEQTYGAPMEVLSHGGMPVVVEQVGSQTVGQPHHGH